MRTLQVLAYAKLNLVLRVVGRREDGYHLLQSLFCAVDWADELELTSIPRGIELEAPAELGPPEGNLAYRAAQALVGEEGPGVRIVLRKNIPVGAGLGGGSADAVAVLAGINRLHGLGKSPEELVRVGAALGADVPFFLGRSPAWVEGIGDRITPVDIPLPPAFLVLVPPFGLPTAEVYRTYDGLGLPFSSPGRVPGVPPFSNDLWPAAAHLRPELRALRELLEGLPSLGVGMTGSGSALFAAFPSRDEAEAARDGLRVPPGARLFVAAPVEAGYKFSG
ncbi:MAG: 4-(cytidine 5'-diphospho)-2-C-methyl-D-erythritol kinase [Candidatus Bipolaricaulota bacterium]|nr:4-(cytidine 5'-diphospho)-2-C-methyl-D-erythritol kinase [Candidatus Bipolaricaulota bacterium]